MLRIYVLALLVTFFTSSCNQGGEYSVDQYFAPSERDTLLADMITYIYVRPPYSTPETRFNSTFRKYYVSNLPKFRFEKLHRTEDGKYYFYLIRPARSVISNIRGVGGFFRMGENYEIVEFKEVFNTPPAELKDLQERGERLFKEMVRKGNVNDYLKHPDFIEWPDERTYYDTLQHEWLSKPGI